MCRESPPPPPTRLSKFNLGLARVTRLAAVPKKTVCCAPPPPLSQNSWIRPCKCTCILRNAFFFKATNLIVESACFRTMFSAGSWGRRADGSERGNSSRARPRGSVMLPVQPPTMPTNHAWPIFHAMVTRQPPPTSIPFFVYRLGTDLSCPPLTGVINKISHRA